MKVFFTILVFSLSLSSFGQYDKKDINLLYNIESKLTEPWEVSVDTITLDEKGINSPTIYVDLFLDTTSVNSTNYGVSIYLWPVNESERIKSIFLNDTSSHNQHFFLQTKNYLVYIPGGETNSIKYNNAFNQLLPELVVFFHKYRRRL